MPAMDMADAMLEKWEEQKTPPSVILGYFLAFSASLLGGLVGGYLGWIYDDGLVPIISGLTCAAFWFLVVWSISGPGAWHMTKLRTNLAPPEFDRVKTVGLRSFDLYVTVHNVQNLYNADDWIGILGNNRQYYVELKVGRRLSGKEEYDYFSVQGNAYKRTCVSANGSFEECFHFNISPTENTLRITLYDQDIFMDDAVGVTDIDITDTVLLGCFPQKKSYQMFRSNVNEDNDRYANQLAGNVIVSFAPGANFPVRAAMSLEDKNKLAFKQMRSLREQLVDKTQQEHGVYGTWMTQHEV